MKEIWNDQPVDPQQPLWRYFRPERFVQALQERQLYFASGREFEDPFEGALFLTPDPPAHDPRSIAHMEENAFEQLRRLTKISCWNRGDYESEGMWKLYASQRKGIAIRTTAERLAASLRPFRLAPTYGEEVPVWGTVRYIDLTKGRAHFGERERFFYKHAAFASENELRVAISLSFAEEFGVPVPERGIQVDFDPAVLVQEIVLGPNLEPERHTEIRQVCESAGLDGLIRTSSLLWTPRYL
jgi:hypothetical protein